MASAIVPLSPEDADRFRAFERRRFDELAQSYNAFFSPVTAVAIAPLLSAVRLVAGMTFLDVATGAGALAGEARRAGAHPIGVDLSPRMIELARRSNPAIEFHVSDVEKMPFGEKSFDAVACNFGLGHFPFPEAALAECVRTLRPGGRVAFSWWDVFERQRITGLFRDAIAEIGVAPPPDVPKGYTMLRFSDLREFRRLLDEAGLSEVTIADHATTHLVPDVDTLWHGGLGSFSVTASAVGHQNEATQKAIRAALERLAAVYQTPRGLQLPVGFRIGSGIKRN